MIARTMSAAVAALLLLLVACATDDGDVPADAPSRGDAALELSETRTFDVPPNRLWHAWTDADQLRRWWGPHGFTVPIVDVDLRAGGSTFICMRAPGEFGGDLFCNTWTYHRIEPPERLEFVLHFTDADRNRLDPAAIPGMPPGIPDSVLHAITLRALDDHRTEMTITEYGYTTEEARAVSKAGLDQVLEKLGTTLSAP